MKPDRKEFINAMHKEVKDPLDHGNFVITHKARVPKDATILPTVRQMKRKRNIRTREVKKYKARLKIDGSHMKKGIHYNETYAPVLKCYINSVSIVQMAHQTIGLCAGVPTGTLRETFIYEDPKRILHP
jgi:hypothetical protein